MNSKDLKRKWQEIQLSCKIEENVITSDNYIKCCSILSSAFVSQRQLTENEIEFITVTINTKLLPQIKSSSSTLKSL